MAAATVETFRATPWFVNFQDFEYEELYIKNVKPTKWIAASDLVLPDGWPKSLDSGFAWDGTDLKHERYVVELSNDDNMIILTALRSFKGESSTATWLLTPSFTIKTRLGAGRQPN
jgi:hypothetical protein